MTATPAIPQGASLIFVGRTAVEAHTLPDESVLLFDGDTGTAIPVNECAGKIWEMCNGAHTVDQIVDNLAAHYDAERIDIDRDTREFLAILARHGFIDRVSFPR